MTRAAAVPESQLVRMSSLAGHSQKWHKRPHHPGFALTCQGRLQGENSLVLLSDSAESLQTSQRSLAGTTRSQGGELERPEEAAIIAAGAARLKRIRMISQSISHKLSFLRVHSASGAALWMHKRTFRLTRTRRMLRRKAVYPGAELLWPLKTRSGAMPISRHTVIELSEDKAPR